MAMRRRRSVPKKDLGRLEELEKTNEMLLKFNNLSNACMRQLKEHFAHQSRSMLEMRKDLDSIYGRLRTLKVKLSNQYRVAFSHIQESPIPEEEEDDVDLVPANSPTTIDNSEQSKEPCDTSPDISSPVLNPDFEDLSQGELDSPAVNRERLTSDEDGGERV
ncbi:kxDL motif-containing protein 1-like [Gracilinanus agilis]|uniref:kxDL motif-containing protein 1-like n=1 Tax=Gracilinanus agilis TaxID=191870 RepID=UPI001CFE0BA0|nr:kxDL motif-containing protein 1-like [Gracilinanus agilis]